MNLPNKLTLLRIILIPVFVLVFYIDGLNETDMSLGFNTIPLSNLLGLVIFAIAAFTDFLDGNIARKHNLVTTFGKFMDPLADKLLVMSALLIGVKLGILPAFVPILILAREFMVTGIRTLAISEGKVIAASNLGKAKTVSQMFMIIFLLLFNVQQGRLLTDFNFNHVDVLINTLFITLATVLTVVSGADYFVKNKEIIFASK